VWIANATANPSERPLRLEVVTTMWESVPYEALTAPEHAMPFGGDPWAEAARRDLHAAQDE
jgi:hypothetical protein